MTRRTTVRWIHLADLDDGLLASVPLGPHERERVEAMRVDADRRLFIGARHLVRATVAEVGEVGPDDVVLHQRCPRCGGPHGPPTVHIGTTSGPHVSMAHAGALAVVAVGPRPVGVDVEPIDGSSIDGQPARSSLGEVDLRTWVRREAVLKAVGLGVDVDPDPVRLGPPDAPPKLVGWAGPGRRPRVHLADVATAPDHLVSVATLGRRRVVDAGPVRVSSR